MAIVDVAIRGFRYEPATVEVKVGDSVKWTNFDGTQHTASRDDAPRFETGPLSRGQAKEIPFTSPTDAAGIEYFCRPHPQMKGRVVVSA